MWVTFDACTLLEGNPMSGVENARETSFIARRVVLEFRLAKREFEKNRALTTFNASQMKFFSIVRKQASVRIPDMLIIIPVSVRHNI